MITTSTPETKAQIIMRRSDLDPRVAGKMIDDEANAGLCSTCHTAGEEEIRYFNRPSALITRARAQETAIGNTVFKLLENSHEEVVSMPAQP